MCHKIPPQITSLSLKRELEWAILKAQASALDEERDKLQRQLKQNKLERAKVDDKFNLFWHSVRLEAKGR